MTDEMNFSFDSMNDVQAHTGQRVIPDSGDYNVMISDIKMESNSKNNGHNIIVTYSIVDGEYAGSELKEWLAVINPNDTAQGIAQSKLKAIYLVTKKVSAKHYRELNGTLLRIRVLKKENTYTDNNGNQRDGFNNEVVMYMDTSGRNSDGKEVAAYAGPTVVAKSAKANSGSSNKNSNASNSGNSNSNSDSKSGFDPNSDNDDDDIPF